MTKVTDFRWTQSQRVQSNSVTSLRLQKHSPTLIGIALQANRVESLPFVSIKVKIRRTRGSKARVKLHILPCYYRLKVQFDSQRHMGSIGGDQK